MKLSGAPMRVSSGENLLRSSENVRAWTEDEPAEDEYGSPGRTAPTRWAPSSELSDVRTPRRSSGGESESPVSPQCDLPELWSQEGGAGPSASPQTRSFATENCDFDPGGIPPRKNSGGTGTLSPTSLSSSEIPSASSSSSLPRVWAGSSSAPGRSSLPAPLASPSSPASHPQPRHSEKEEESPPPHVIYPEASAGLRSLELSSETNNLLSARCPALSTEDELPPASHRLASSLSSHPSRERASGVEAGETKKLQGSAVPNSSAPRGRFHWSPHPSSSPEEESGRLAAPHSTLGAKAEERESLPALPREPAQARALPPPPPSRADAPKARASLSGSVAPGRRGPAGSSSHVGTFAFRPAPPRAAETGGDGGDAEVCVFGQEGPPRGVVCAGENPGLDDESPARRRAGERAAVRQTPAADVNEGPRRSEERRTDAEKNTAAAPPQRRARPIHREAAGREPEGTRDRAGALGEQAALDAAASRRRLNPESEDEAGRRASRARGEGAAAVPESLTAPTNRPRARRPTDLQQARFGSLGVSAARADEARRAALRRAGTRPSSLALQQPQRPESPFHFCAPSRLDDRQAGGSGAPSARRRSRAARPSSGPRRYSQRHGLAGLPPECSGVPSGLNDPRSYLKSIKRKARREVFPAFGVRSPAHRVSDAKLLVPAAKREGNLEAATQRLYALGVVLDNKRRWTQAISAYQDLLACAQTLGDRDLQVLAHNCLGIDFLRCEAFEEALQHHTQQLSLADEDGQYVAHMNIGLVCSRLDKPEDAAAHYRAAAEIAARRRNLVRHSLAVGNLGLTVFPTGDLKTSRRCMEYHLDTIEEIFSAAPLAAKRNWRFYTPAVSTPSASSPPPRPHASLSSAGADAPSAMPAASSPSSLPGVSPSASSSFYLCATVSAAEAAASASSPLPSRCAAAASSTPSSSSASASASPRSASSASPRGWSRAAKAAGETTGEAAARRGDIRVSFEDSQEKKSENEKAKRPREEETLNPKSTSASSAHAHPSPSLRARASGEEGETVHDPGTPRDLERLEDASTMCEAMQKVDTRPPNTSCKRSSLPQSPFAVFATLDSQHHLGRVDAATGDYVQAAERLFEARLMAKKAGEADAEVEANVAYGVVQGRLHFEDYKKRILESAADTRAARNWQNLFSSFSAAPQLSARIQSCG
ncbi:hypothetical protein BESB_012080 [Besnoitia besnoiti]|uniref:Uncharacterized protein n=1 Tax=Besnoitia besnoiti TaxID=94643 RepID=A0A2A9M9K3_BESBE|nr:hypothetical protein BESB_012080 [Besnoitia besnoiti]PFH32596.1 hypothetical protein BESB_012080 [Besnoitia besnoiti]